MIKSKLIANALEKSGLPIIVIEELIIIIEALEGIDLTEAEIINQLKEDYDLEV